MRKPAALLFIFFIALASAVPVVEWNKTFGAMYADVGYSVQQTSDGGYIMVGTAWSAQESWLIKTDGNGELQWEKKITEAASLRAVNLFSVQQTSDGGYILAGAGVPSCNACDFLLLLIKTDSSGNSEWEKQFIDKDWERGDGAVSVHQTSDGGYIIGGMQYTSDRDGWVIKTNSSGGMEWNMSLSWPAPRTNGRRTVQYVNQIQDDYIAAGQCWAGYYADYGSCLIKYNSSGSQLWKKIYSTNPASLGIAFSAYPIPNGYMVLEKLVTGSAYESPIRLIKTNADGEALQTTAFDGARSVWYAPGFSTPLGPSSAPTSDGGYIIADGTPINDAKGGDVLLIKTDSQGTMEWNATFGGPMEDVAHSVQQTSDGGYIVAGATTPEDSGFSDMWLVKIKIVDNASITIESPLEGELYGNVFIDLNYTVVNLTSAQVEGCAYSVDDSQPPAPDKYDPFCLNYSLSAQVLGEGSHRVYVFAKDSAGGVSEANVSFLIDLTPPNVTIFDPKGGYTQASALLEYDAHDALTGVTCKYTLDGGTQFHDLPGCRDLVISVAPGIGSHTVAVYAWDEVGNMGAASSNFNVDTTTPLPPTQVGIGECASDSVRRMIDDGAGGLIALVIFTTIVALGLIYMVAYALNRQEYILLVKDELFHLGVSIAILIAFGMIMSVSCALVGDAFNFAYHNINKGSLTDPCYGQGTTVQSVSVCYMHSMEEDAKEIINTYTKANIDLQLKASGYVSYYGLLSGTTFAPKAYMRSQAAFIDNVNNIFVIPAYVSIYAQDVFMRYFVGYATRDEAGNITNPSAILGLLLPGAFVLRFFPPTRQVGNMLIAFSVGIYLIIPVFIALNAIMYQYTFTPQDCSTIPLYRDVIADPISIWGGSAVTGSADQALLCDSSASLLAVARLYPQAFLLPNIIIVVFIAFMTSVNKALKVLG
ncbi:MAG: hypothetical protein PHS02_01270 [Candidatus ainarchaeum sp.]|nr:hypothetical protein [Candidatus ainarchaeum sp.]